VLAGTQDQKAAMQLTLASAGDFSPEGYVAELQRRGTIAGATGGVETIGGYRAWIGVLRVVRNGAEARLAAGFIRQSPERTLQILGQSAVAGDANEAAMIASMRSVRPLTDPARLNAEPDRVHVFAAPAAGTFEEIVTAQGAQALDLEQTSILNNLMTDEQVFKRQLVKIVKPGRVR
jgi:predicted Zn-dependent protease